MVTLFKKHQKIKIFIYWKQRKRPKDPPEKQSKKKIYLIKLIVTYYSNICIFIYAIILF
jgi:hypothetical protein